MQETRVTYYMNCAANGGAPTHKFDVLDEALKEAKRLCEKLNCEVVTMMAVASIKPTDKFQYTQFEKQEDYPF